MSEQNHEADGSDPWPFGSEIFADPPWLMTADVLTSWLRVRTADLEPYVAAEFLPRTATALGRLRLYRINAQTPSGSIAFSEVVLAFRAPRAYTNDELSFLMWTDSLEYLTWGREVFGWPLRLTELPFGPDLWSAPGGSVSLPQCHISVTVRSWTGSGPETEAPPARWITPRRRLLSSPSLEAARDVLIVSPEVIAQGKRTFVDADVDVSHWLPSATCEWSEISHGVVLRVGGMVTIR